MPVQKHVSESSDEERLFQVYKELVVSTITQLKMSPEAWSNVESFYKQALEDAKLIMEVFNTRNLNDKD